MCGFHTGYGGPGIKTVLPAEATAKLDFRLVPDQDPADILEKLRAHLDAAGFHDVEIVVEGPEPPARTDPGDPLVAAVVAAARRAYGAEPVVMPLMAGTGPMYELCQRWGIPAVGAGVGWAGSRSHAPNENIRLEDLQQGIKHIALIMEEFSAAESWSRVWLKRSGSSSMGKWRESLNRSTWAWAMFGSMRSAWLGFTT